MSKHVYDLVLQAKEETVLQGMNCRLIEIGKCYGIEMNGEKVMRTSGQPSTVKITIKNSPRMWNISNNWVE
jgi:hypothetical protein